GAGPVQVNVETAASILNSKGHWHAGGNGSSGEKTDWGAEQVRQHLVANRTFAESPSLPCAASESGALLPGEVGVGFRFQRHIGCWDGSAIATRLRSMLRWDEL